MSHAEDMCQEIIAAKQGDTDMAIFHCPWQPAEKRWLVMLGNPSEFVMLGEAEGELEAEGPTLDHALQAMLKLVRPEKP